MGSNFRFRKFFRVFLLNSIPPERILGPTSKIRPTGDHGGLRHGRPRVGGLLSPPAAWEGCHTVRAAPIQAHAWACSFHRDTRHVPHLVAEALFISPHP